MFEFFRLALIFLLSYHYQYSLLTKLIHGFCLFFFPFFVVIFFADLVWKLELKDFNNSNPSHVHLTHNIFHLWLSPFDCFRFRCFTGFELNVTNGWRGMMKNQVKTKQTASKFIHVCWHSKAVEVAAALQLVCIITLRIKPHEGKHRSWSSTTVA